MTNASNESDLLDRLARAAGIAPEWDEMNGPTHRVSDETKRAILAGMGLDVGSQGAIQDAIEGIVAARDRRTLSATSLAWEGEAPALRVVAPGASGRVMLAIEQEDGFREEVAIDLDHAERYAFRAADDSLVEALTVRLPIQPIGRHKITLDGDVTHSCALTVAPRRCFLPDALRHGSKALGVAAQLYSLRSQGDQGLGDFTTLARFAGQAGRHGCRLVGLNPLHTLSAEHRDQVSPYYPSDRRFLEPFYIDVTAPEVVGDAPEAARLLEARAADIARLSALPAIDYAAVWALKRAVLEAAFAVFDLRRHQHPTDPLCLDFARFVHDGGAALADFALFAAISAGNGGAVWWTWPEDQRTPHASGAGAYRGAHAREIDFQFYLQWLADRQLAKAAAAGRAAGLEFGFYRDLAVGTAHGGAENWANQGIYALGISVGAPPDAFSADGQTWGLPPPNPMAPGRAWLDVFSGLLAANMRHAGALRIDHAMGLARLFWIPEGMPGSAGAYVHYPFEQMIGELALESHRARCMVIGEDLGTVPSGFRDRLAAADILSYRVLFFERNGLDFLPAHNYPEKAVACVTIHDLPTFAGWWRGAEIDERQALGSFTAEQAERHRADRAREREKLMAATGRSDLAAREAADDEIVAAVHRFVAGAPSVLVMAQADDLAGETVAINLPGTSGERPNWRRRLTVDVDALFDTPLAQAGLPAR